MIARLAAMRLLPIRSRCSRYDNHPAANAAPSITMTPPQTRVSITVRIENVRSTKRILPSPLGVGRRLPAMPRTESLTNSVNAQLSLSECMAEVVDLDQNFFLHR